MGEQDCILKYQRHDKHVVYSDATYSPDDASFLSQSLGGEIVPANAAEKEFTDCPGRGCRKDKKAETMVVTILRGQPTHL